MGCINSRVSFRNLQIIDYNFLVNETVATFSHKIKNDFEYLNSVVNSIDVNGMTYLSYVCMYANHLFKYLMESKLIEKCDMERRDNRGRTFLHYLFMNDNTDVKDIEDIFKYKKFICIQNILEQAIDDEGNTFIHIAAINKHYGYLSHVRLDKLVLLDAVNNNNNTLLSFAVLDEQEDLIKDILDMRWKSNRFITAPYPYANILAILLHKNEKLAIRFMKKKKNMMKFILDDFYKLTIDDDYEYTLLSLVCYLEKRDFIKEYVKKKYLTLDDIHTNFFYLCKLLRPIMICKILQKIDPDLYINKTDENHNNLLQFCIIEKPNLINELVRNELIDIRILGHKNKQGDNSFLVACKHNFSMAVELYNNFHDAPEYILDKNTQNYDCVDILLNREKQEGYPYLTNLLDDDLYDNHKRILTRFKQMKNLKTDEILYLRNLEAQNKPDFDNVDAHYNENECIICMEQYNSVLLSCGHKFCIKCIYKTNTCPTCRQKITIRKFSIYESWVVNPYSICK